MISHRFSAPSRTAETGTRIAHPHPDGTKPTPLVSTVSDFYRGRFADYRQSNADDPDGGYVLAIQRLDAFLERPAVLSDLTDDVITRWLKWLQRKGWCKKPKKPLAGATINNKYRAPVLALWNYAFKVSVVPEPPKLVPRYPEKTHNVTAWTLAEFQQLLAAAAKLPGAFCHGSKTPFPQPILAATWWCSFLSVLYDTGLRVNAVLQLRVSDLDRDWLRVPDEHQKQHMPQTLQIHADTLALIEATNPAGRPGKPPLLFPWPFSSDRVIRDRLRALLRAAELPDSKRDLFHKIRRTNATQLAIATDESTVQRQLGHSSIDVTRRYIDPSQLPVVNTPNLIARPRIDR